MRQLSPLLPHPAAIPGVYRQPFCGGGSPFWQLYAPRPDRALLSDANPLLIDTYIAIRDHLPSLITNLQRIEAAGYGREQYMAVRAELNAGRGDLVERAACFKVISAWGFNGLWRVNHKGHCNVPMGRTSTGKAPVLCDVEGLRACSEALQGVEVVCEPFWATMARAQPGDHLYADPPYCPVSKTANFTSYTTDGFSYGTGAGTDHHRLLSSLEDLDRRGVMWALSQADEPTVRSAYQERGWTIHQVSARRLVNSDATKRGPVGELLVTGRVQWAAVAGDDVAEAKRGKAMRKRKVEEEVLPRQMGLFSAEVL